MVMMSGEKNTERSPVDWTKEQTTQLFWLARLVQNNPKLPKPLAPLQAMCQLPELHLTRLGHQAQDNQPPPSTGEVGKSSRSPKNLKKRLNSEPFPSRRIEDNPFPWKPQQSMSS